ILCINQSYSNDSITLQEFLNLPIILREDSSCSYAMVEEFTEKIGVKIENLNISFSSNSINITKDSVLNSSACAFFPKSAIGFELNEGLLKKLEFKNLDVTTKVSYYYSLIKRKDYTLNSYEQKFEDFILTI
ncbi:MAG: LysR substrate-binding domain-containing protein, partial [Halanaerobiales bacterium]